jgi:signal transduction histidine kinase
MTPSDNFLLDLCTIIGYELIIAFQLVYIFFQWIFIRQREYLYYMVFMTACMMFGLLKYHHVPLPGINQGMLAAAEPYFDKALPMLSYFFYFRFARSFVGIPIKIPRLNKHIQILEWILLIYAITDVSLAFSGVKMIQREIGFQIIATILFFSTIYFVTTFFRLGDRLGYFAVAGGSVLTLGSVASMVLLILQSNGTTFSFNPLIFNLSTSIFELLAFTTGLAFKANLIEKEKTLAGERLIEKLNENIELQQKMNSIRHDAAKELHDEVAGGLSDVSIYADLVNRTIPPQLEKEHHLLRQIRGKSLSMMDSIHDLIWALNPAHQRMNDLSQKLNQVSREFLAPVNANWMINLYDNQDAKEFNPDSMRRIVSLYRTALHEYASLGIVNVAISAHHAAYIDINLNFSNALVENSSADRLQHLVNRYNARIERNIQSITLSIPITTISD